MADTQRKEKKIRPLTVTVTLWVDDTQGGHVWADNCAMACMRELQHGRACMGYTIYEWMACLGGGPGGHGRAASKGCGVA